MNNRELFHATMRRENGSLLLHAEMGHHKDLGKSWPTQGLPAHVSFTGPCALTDGENVFDHFNMSGFLWCGFNQFCLPPFEHKVIEKTDDRITFVNGNGVTMTLRTDSEKEPGSGSPPHEIDFVIKTKMNYEENRFRLTGEADKRTNRQMIEEKARAYGDQQDFLVSLWAHGPFAFLRDLLGAHNAMILPYTEPDMIRMMLDDHLQVCMAASEPMIRAFKPDLCYVWEDCCGSTGPFIAPVVFEELMAPWYRAWKDFLRSMGVPWIVLDTDGDPSPLVRAWYENGVDCMLPWEVNGVDMLKFATEYPQYVMMGGIYKHMFQPEDLSQVGRFTTTDVRRCIDDELERVVRPMIKRGGYIAALDHGMGYYVKYPDFKYYSAKLEAYGKANKSTRFPPAPAGA